MIVRCPSKQYQYNRLSHIFQFSVIHSSTNSREPLRNDKQKDKQRNCHGTARTPSRPKGIEGAESPGGSTLKTHGNMQSKVKEHLNFKNLRKPHK